MMAMSGSRRSGPTSSASFARFLREPIALRLAAHRETHGETPLRCGDCWQLNALVLACRPSLAGQMALEDYELNSDGHVDFA